MPYFEEPFTDTERQVLSRFFTNADQPVFALINLPEVVKGALFARYSRSAKSVRRLFLDEFYNQPEFGIEAIAAVSGAGDPATGLDRAERLYDRVFSEYGDDSVAQLGGAHLACEQASNLLTKILERGRIASYLEQSTRYIYYDRPLGGRYRYFIPPEVTAAGKEADFRAVIDGLFNTYSDLVSVMVPYFERMFPKDPSDPDRVYTSTIRAKACDTIRGLLPAATTSNLGIFASGQAYEALLLRMRSHPLAEARDYAGMMLSELRMVIPSFLKRVDVPDRGGAWSDYLAGLSAAASAACPGIDADPVDNPEVDLVEWDDDAESEVIVGAIYPESRMGDRQVREAVDRLSTSERANLFRSMTGERKNRRHRPGRGFERASYRFDLLTDFGIFRDLQRHRMLTIDWQRLSTSHGYATSPFLEDAGVDQSWHDAMERAGELAESLGAACSPDVAQYAVPFAYRIRYSMQLNAREAMHMLELRTAEGGHADYRRVCQQMHTQIRDRAGHRLVADAMRFVDYNDYELGRLNSERRAETRRTRVTEPRGGAPD